MKKRFLISSILGWFCLVETGYGWTILAPDLKGWATDTLQLGVNYSNCPISDSELNAVLDYAIAAWNNVNTSRLVLTRGTSSTSVATFQAGTATDCPVILCDLNFSTAGPDPDNIPAYVSPGVTYPLTYGGMILNAEVGAGANVGLFSDTVLKIIVGHEMGHLLGLGHSQDPNAMMYYSVSGKSDVVLTQDDADGMAYLYPKNEFSSGMFGCAARHQKTNSASALGWSVLFMGLLFLCVLLGRAIPLRRNVD